MRRNDKAITDREEIDSIIRISQVCRLAMCEGGLPYVVPLCFGYDEGTLYFHSASEGLKLDVLKRNNRVCFEMDIAQELIRPNCDNRDNCSMRYKSVIGFGRAYFIREPAEKMNALDIIMRHYSQEPFAYPEAVIANTEVFKVEIEGMTGKNSGY